MRGTRPGEGLPFGKRLKDNLNDPFGIQQNVVVPKTQHTPTLVLEHGRAPLIGSIAGVLAAICLDGKPVFGAGEVEDEPRDRILPAEPKAR